MTEVQTARERCRACGYEMDHATGAGHGGIPGPGDLSLCLNCGELSVFTPGMRRRSPTAEELDRIRASRAWDDIVEARARIAERGAIR